MYKETASESDYMPKPQWMLEMYKQKAKRYATCGKTNLTAKQTEKLAVATMIANGECYKWSRNVYGVYEDCEVEEAFADYIGTILSDEIDRFEVGDKDAINGILIVRVK